MLKVVTVKIQVYKTLYLKGPESDLLFYLVTKEF